MTRRLAAAMCMMLVTACTPTAPLGTEPAHPTPTPPPTVQALDNTAAPSPGEGSVGPNEQSTVGPTRDVHGNDPVGAGELEAAVAVAAQVVDGWLTADQSTRRNRLTDVAAGALVDAFDDPRYTPIPHTTVGPVHLLMGEAMRVVTRHRLDTGAAVDVTLIPDPATSFGWIAIAITEA